MLVAKSLAAFHSRGYSTLASPLAGIRVLDLSRILAGPYATMILGDLGAEIVKIEHPDGEIEIPIVHIEEVAVVSGGEDTRRWGPPFLHPNESQHLRETPYFMTANRNKKSVCVDMKQERGNSNCRPQLHF